MTHCATDRVRRERLWRAAALVLGAAVLSLGCSPLTVISFLWPGDSRIKPEYPLVCKDKKETKIVVLAAFTALDTVPETNGADQELAERLITVLKKKYEEDGQKVKIVPHYQVRDYHNKSPFAQTPYEVGKHFDADKVVYLEIGRMSLYKEKSNHTLFSGRVDMTVTATDMHLPREEGPPFHQEYVCEYPQGRELPADGSNPSLFRATFLDHVANDLSRFFTPYELDPGDKMGTYSL
jgi:hypothetical protein